MKGLDPNGDGEIAYGEFTRAVKAQAGRVERRQEDKKVGGDLDAMNAEVTSRMADGANAARLGFTDGDGDGRVNGDDFYKDKAVDPRAKKVT